MMFIVCTILLSALSLTSSITQPQRIISDYFDSVDKVVPFSLLYESAKTGSELNLTVLTEKAIAERNVEWLRKAASIGSTSAMMELAHSAVSQNISLRWYKRAARAGDKRAWFELSLLEADRTKRLNYLTKSAEQFYRPAIISLAYQLYELGEVEEAITWLSQASEYDPKSRFLLAKAYWLDGQYKKSKEYFLASRTYSYMSEQYAEVIEDFQELTLDRLYQSSKSLNSDCAQQLQFVASNIHSMVQAVEFRRQFNQDDRMKALSICINPPIWLEENQLSCNLNQHRQECDFSDLSEQTFSPDFTHLVLFLESGKAYVHRGVMYLDHTDTYSVFVHELAHFSGFVDEYPLNPLLAQQFCDPAKSPLNLLVSETPTQTSKYKKWKAIRFNNAQDHSNAEVMQEWTLAPSKTCDRLNISSFKPSTAITFMEHHDTNHIPELYLQLWQLELEKDFQQRAVSAAFINSAKSANSKDYWSRMLFVHRHGQHTLPSHHKLPLASQ